MNKVHLRTHNCFPRLRTAIQLTDIRPIGGHLARKGERAARYVVDG